MPKVTPEKMEVIWGWGRRDRGVSGNGDWVRGREKNSLLLNGTENGTVRDLKQWFPMFLSGIPAEQ